MKKYTNKILIITGIIILIINIILITIAIQKYENGTLNEWFGDVVIEETTESSDTTIVILP